MNKNIDQCSSNRLEEYVLLSSYGAKCATVSTTLTIFILFPSTITIAVIYVMWSGHWINQNQ